MRHLPKKESIAFSVLTPGGQAYFKRCKKLSFDVFGVDPWR